MLALLDPVFWLVFSAVMITAAWFDVLYFRIPNILSLILLGLYPLHVLLAPAPVGWVGGIVAALAVLAVGIAAFAFGKLGGGDVKLLAMGALWAGQEGIATFLLATTLTGGVVGLFLLSPFRMVAAHWLDTAGLEHARNMVIEQKLPYGTAIAIGGLAVAVPRILGIT